MADEVKDSDVILPGITFRLMIAQQAESAAKIAELDRQLAIALRALSSRFKYYKAHLVLAEQALVDEGRISKMEVQK